MTASLVNGQPGNLIPTSDRGLLYGDGVFETIAISKAQPRHWPRHMSRLRAGCTRLGLQPPENKQLAAEAQLVIEGIDRGVLKLIITRGSGGRGYRVPELAACTRIMQVYPWPEYPAVCAEQGIIARLCATRLGRNPALAGIKHLNRLEQVLARQEWNDADIHEGLLMDTDDNLVEGTKSNLFIVSDGVLLTPDLSHCGVAGVMRTIILEQAQRQRLKWRIVQLGQQDLLRADEVFLANSLIGIWPVIAIGETTYRIGPITQLLQELLPDSGDDDCGWQA
ncbi:MAG: aminodeoxychorismate lyase [Gammaproteobacteria bacterium]